MYRTSFISFQQILVNQFSYVQAYKIWRMGGPITSLPLLSLRRGQKGHLSTNSLQILNNFPTFPEIYLLVSIKLLQPQTILQTPLERRPPSVWNWSKFIQTVNKDRAEQNPKTILRSCVTKPPEELSKDSNTKKSTAKQKVSLNKFRGKNFMMFFASRNFLLCKVGQRFVHGRLSRTLTIFGITQYIKIMSNHKIVTIYNQ